MTGPEHYREAERLLANADRWDSATWATQSGETKADVLDAAQVHATLAQAAATLDVQLNRHLLAAWAEALS